MFRLSIFLVALILSAPVTANEHGAAPAAAAPTAPPPEPTHAELRERYRKRLEELSKSREPASTAETHSAPSEQDITQLHTVLKDREKKITEREAALQGKERELNEKQQFLEQQLGKYEATVAKLRQEVKNLASSRDEKVSAFRMVYEKMEAKKAARILNDLDTALAGRVLSGMRQQHAADILAKMEPEKARQITKRFLSSAVERPAANTILSP
jgi:flagellar motility protein MotE (MotC chaperone)